MRTKKLALTGGLIMVLALIGYADFGAVTVTTPMPEFQLGGMAALDVQFAPDLVGGHFDVYRTIEGYPTEMVHSLPIDAPNIHLDEPVPGDPIYAGHMLTFTIEAFNMQGLPGGEGSVTRGARPPWKLD